MYARMNVINKNEKNILVTIFRRKNKSLPRFHSCNLVHKKYEFL